MSSPRWPLPFEVVDFIEQRERIDDGAVANDADLARMQRARRHQAQDEFLAIDDQRVRGVVAALKADDHVGVGRQQVDNFAFAFIAPLGADHGDSFHIMSARHAHIRAPGVARPPVESKCPVAKSSSEFNQRRCRNRRQSS